MEQWFLENYKWLLVLVFDVVILIFSLIRRVKVVGTPLDKVIEKLPEFISFVERKLGAGAGSEKLAMVLRLSEALFTCLGGTGDISEVVKVKVEEILSTPQKKGDINV